MSPRLKLLLIGAVCAAPIVLATLAWWLDWAPGTPGNYGELVTPRPLGGPPFEALRGKWVLATFDGGACDAACERKLYVVRQVRKAQGKDQTRIERLWAVTDGVKPRPELLAAIEGTQVVAFNDKSFSPDYIYVIDPLGNLMLRFPRDPDPKQVIKDLTRLLKYSRIG